MIRARVVGTGHFLPEKVLTNFDLEKITDTSDEWIRQRTGIHQRHVVAPGEGASDLGIQAGRRALEDAGMSASDIDLVICCTTTADYIFPATACVVQNALGMATTPSFDINAACSGFMYGLATSDSFIRSGMYKNILLIGTEVASNRMNFQKRDTAVLFGDGAGAMVLSASKGDRGVLTTHLWSDGSGREILWFPAGGSKTPITRENIDTDVNTINMKGKELFKRAVVEFVAAVQVALEAANVSIDQIDLFIPHQANQRIISAVGERLGLPEEKVFSNIDKVANCTAGSIPLAFDQAVKQGLLKEGALVLLSSFGAGLTWASAVVRL
ncbi:MAG: ketoacyl-ACP synthase III [Candidatus Hydrogenedentes bacterium]|nr:ketoacyl-ACP synthase III [Candidatus Hydrogenedentota bacterium]